MEYTVKDTMEAFVLENVEPANREILSNITECYRHGKDTAKKYAEHLDSFIKKLSVQEKNKIYKGITETIAIPAIKISQHFCAKMLERYAGFDFYVTCARIRQCVKSAFKNKIERVKKDDLVVVVAPEERLLITLYTRLI